MLSFNAFKKRNSNSVKQKILCKYIVRKFNDKGNQALLYSLVPRAIKCVGSSGVGREFTKSNYEL